MGRKFNVTADCKPNLHYMVDISSRLAQMKGYVDRGEYFTINRARQYGKTTMLRAMKEYLKDEYYVVSMDFQMQMSHAKFRDENTFSVAFAKAFIRTLRNLDADIPEKMEDAMKRLEAAAQECGAGLELVELFQYLSDICREADRPLVLMVDETDSAANNQVFMDFLAQLRGYYIDRDHSPTFQSVILAGVYDIKNLKRKFHPEEEHRRNSPWNIAVEFKVDMSFSAEEIAGMLEDYEEEHATGMDVVEIAGLLYEYTSGYPFLVSRLCKLMDEEIAGSGNFPEKKMAWTCAGSYNALNQVIGTAEMLGFIKNANGVVAIANRIFETVFYDLFLTSAEAWSTDIYKAAIQDKNQFIHAGHLNMELVLERFVTHFDDLYGDRPDKFREEDGRRYFLLYLRPIINGTGNYYVESRTRNMERTDVIVDYRGEQMVVELKIWRGNAYHERGEEQLMEYLEHYHLKKGYMLSYNFNRNKEAGVRRIVLSDKVLVEAVV